MPDWTRSMEQTFEYYIVDPGTWLDKKRIHTVISSSIDRDSSVETLGSATIDIAEPLDECYVRIYLITIQNRIEEKFPLGTYLVQTPSTKFDGKTTMTTMDAYTPLLELKESPPPIGYYIPKAKNIMEYGVRLTREHVRAPVVGTSCTDILNTDFVANTDDTWLSFNSDLLANAKHRYDVDELGRILFAPEQDTASLRPVHTYTDDNSSILYPDINLDRDLYGIPNVVEVVYSDDNRSFYSRVVNDDPNSPISTVNRGREIIHRVTNPEIIGSLTKMRIDEYAERMLREMSTLEHTISYKHGYIPNVRVGDCVRLNYSRAGLNGIKAKIISQNIKCEPGCPVTEKAVYTTKLWG